VLAVVRPRPVRLLAEPEALGLELDGARPGPRRQGVEQVRPDLPPVAGSVTFQPSAVKVPPLRRVAVVRPPVNGSLIVVAASTALPRPIPNPASLGTAVPNMAAAPTAAAARIRDRFTK
jgi:hypothetical protein